MEVHLSLMSGGLRKLSHGGVVLLTAFALLAACQGTTVDQEGEVDPAPSDEGSDEAGPGLEQPSAEPEPDVATPAVEEVDPLLMNLVASIPPDEKGDGTGGTASGVGGTAGTNGGLAGSSGMGGESNTGPSGGGKGSGGSDSGTGGSDSGTGGTETVDPCEGADMCCGLDDGLYCAVDREAQRDEFSVLCSAGEIAAVTDCTDKCLRRSGSCDDSGGGNSGGDRDALSRPVDLK
jgi:hypothetical protein